MVAAAGALGALPAWAEGKMAVVDFQRLAQESPQGKAIMESMRAEFSPRERTLQAQMQALKAKQDKLQKDAATMTEDQRVRAEKEFATASATSSVPAASCRTMSPHGATRRCRGCSAPSSRKCAATPRRRTSTWW